MGEVRVRFAPSPTGYLHIGGARTALFNYLFARKNGGKFILRIEDTDEERTIEDSAEKLMQSFRWLGLQWDEGPIVGGPAGPYFQSQRRELYRKYAKLLVDRNQAYYCYCTPEELAEDRERARQEKRAPRYSGRCVVLTPDQRAAFEASGRVPAIRFRTPESGTTVVHDLIKGEVPFKNEEISDFIILKSDGYPTYNFACVVDDWLMGLTHVIRADEHLSNTPKQMMLYRTLQAPMPKFAHVPMILAPDRSKLSKRHGAQSVEEFRDMGLFPDALLNYLVLLGWTPADSTKEIMSLDDMVDEFDLSRISTTPAIYDTTKMFWMNGYYLRALDTETLAQRYIAAAASSGFDTRENLLARKSWVAKVVLSFQPRCRTIDEMVLASRYYFYQPSEYDEAGTRKLFAKAGSASLLRKGAAAFSALDPETGWNLESEEKAYHDLAQNEGIKTGDIIHPTRLALTGRTSGPGLFEIVDILGQEETVRRLRDVADRIESGEFGVAKLEP